MSWLSGKNTGSKAPVSDSDGSSGLRRFPGVGADRSRSTSPAPSLSPAEPERPSPIAIQNPAFEAALQKHIATLSPSEQQAFNIGAEITPDVLLAKVQEFDNIHRKSDRFRNCTARVEHFLKILDKYLTPLVICIGNSPTISSLVVGGLKLIIDIGIRFVEFFNQLTEMIDRLAEHLGYLMEFAESFIDTPKVQEALSDVYGDLLEFFKCARNVFADDAGNPRSWVSFRVFVRTMWEPFQSNFEAINMRFDDCVQIVLRTAGIAEHKRLRSKELPEAQEKDDDERQKLLEWLAGLSGLNFEEDHDRIFKKRHGNTGNWLVESPEFTDWEKEEKSCLLWCYGNPGVGKSVLASLILETVSKKYALDDRIGIAFVYFNFQEQGAQASKKILAELIKQLCCKHKAIPDHLGHFYKSYAGNAEIPSYAKLQDQLVELSKSFDQVSIIMDAMDECGDRENFLPFVTALAQASSNFKIFVTSRRERDILDAFTKGGFPAIQIEATKVDADISAFVEFQVEHRATQENLCDIDSELMERIKKALVSQSNGMFLWVKYQLDYIYEQSSIHDIEIALNSLPENMNETYLRILRKIDKQPKAMKDLAKRTLLWVVTAARPLTIWELCIAVSIEPTAKSQEDLKDFQEKTVLDACGNFIGVEKGLVRPVHYTVQEFLRSSKPTSGIENPSLLEKYQVCLEEAHVELAESCIRYMLFPEFRRERVYYHNHMWTSLQGRCYLSNYTCKYWDHHFLAPASVPDSLCNTFRDWMDSGDKLAMAYCSRYQTNIGDMNAFDYCLAIGMLPTFQRLCHFDISAVDSREYKESLHHAARGGSIAPIQVLLNLGFSVHSWDEKHVQPLYYAVERNHEPAVMLLLAQGADVNADRGHSVLGAAALMGHERMVKLLLEKGAAIDAVDNPLQVAAEKGHEKVVKILLENGADVNAESPDSPSALYVASLGQYEKVVHMLLEKGAKVNAEGGDYGNPLGAAVYGGHIGIVKTLLERGADVHFLGKKYGSALNIAAARYTIDEEILRMLLEKGSDVNAPGGVEGNVLQAAAKSYGGRGRTAVKILLENGADVNAPSMIYCNALQPAAEAGDAEVVRTFLAHGANIHAKGGNRGNTLNAAVYSGHREVVEVLLENGADANAIGGESGTALLEAVTAKYPIKEDVVKLLLEYGADVNIPGGRLCYALTEAAVYGRDDVVQMLLERGANVNAQGGSEGNALCAAACRGNEKITQMLLEKGADVNAQSGDSGSPLHAAALGGNEKVVQMLLDRGADVNAQGGEYCNALNAAILPSWKIINEVVIQMLLENGADVNRLAGEYGCALQAAAMGGKENVVQMLLKNGVDVNISGGKYGNALTAAAAAGHGNVVDILLENGANPNAQSEEYGNALYISAYNGYENVVQILLEKGADVNAPGGRRGNAKYEQPVYESLPDGKYGNALYAAVSKGHESIVQILLEKGWSVNVQSGKYGNALNAAAHRGSEKMVKMLLEKGADVTPTSGSCGSVLQAVALGGSEKAVQMLLEKGADANSPGGKYGNPLNAAAWKGHERLVQILLEAGADIDAQGAHGNALHISAFKGYKTIVQILLEKGLDVNTAGGKYGNPLHAAVSNGNEKVARILLGSGADINAQGGDYGNALQAAVYQSRASETFVATLLEKGADVNAQGGKYGNALQSALSRWWANEPVVKLLLENGAEVNAQGGKYGSPLQAAALSGLRAMVQILLQKGADVNAQGGKYGNPLQAAIKGGNDQVVSMLLDAGADVNAMGGLYGTALQAAIRGQNWRWTKPLLERGADPNIQGGEYDNALNSVAFWGWEDTARLLLEYGADINAQGTKYGTPFQAASQNQQSTMISFFTKWIEQEKSGVE